MRARFAFVATAFSFLALSSAASAADKCFPACRAGFICSPQGTCVSECNPPCASGETCSAGQCKGSSSSTAGTSDTPRATQAPQPQGQGASSKFAEASAPDDAQDGPPSSRLGALMGGFAFTFGNLSAWGLTATLQFKTAGDHAFVIGPRASLMFANALFTTQTFGAFGLDLGYRGNFVPAKTFEAGVVALGLPNASVGLTGGTLVTIPITVGGFIHYKAFEAQMVVGGGPAIGISSGAGSTTVNGIGAFLVNAGVAF